MSMTAHRHYRTASCITTVIALTAVLPDSTLAFHDASSGIQSPQAQTENSAEPVPFAEVIAFARRQGMSADLGRLCRAFGLERSPSGCRFKQIAIDAYSGGEHHGFNVPLQNTETHYVVIFRLRPLIGEFFVVSAQGELLSAGFRAKGVDYSVISNAEARSAFEAEVSFWQRSVAALENQLKVAPTPGKEVRP